MVEHSPRRKLATEFRVSSFEFRILGFGFRVSSFGFRFSVSGNDLGLGVEDRKRLEAEDVEEADRVLPAIPRLRRT